MEMTTMEYFNTDNSFNPVFTEAFMCEDSLYNASYIPTDDCVATIMLEKVIKYPEEEVSPQKKKINMVLITIINSGRIKIDSEIEENKSYETALACATAAYKFDLVKNYLAVELLNTSIPMHINSSNR